MAPHVRPYLHRSLTAASGAKQGDAAVPRAQLAVRFPTARARQGGPTGRSQNGTTWDEAWEIVWHLLVGTFGST